MLVAKHTASNRPLDLAIRSYVPRTLLAGLSAFALVHFAPRETYALMKTGEATWWDIWPFYAALLTVTLAYRSVPCAATVWCVTMWCDRVVCGVYCDSVL